MSKAILITNMPESCSKCQFLYEFNGTKKCQLMNVLYNGASKVSQSKFTIERHHKCPLKPLPEKKKLGKFTSVREDMKAIGTVDECREAKEKQRVKQVILYGDCEDGKLICPSCSKDLWDLRECGFDFCPYCSQAIKFGGI